MKRKIFIFSTIIIIIDFIIKLLALNNITNICVIPNFFYLTLAKNTGAAFSLLENKTIFFIIIGILVIFYIFKYKMPFFRKILIVSSAKHFDCTFIIYVHQ